MEDILSGPRCLLALLLATLLCTCGRALSKGVRGEGEKGVKGEGSKSRKRMQAGMLVLATMLLPLVLSISTPLPPSSLNLLSADRELRGVWMATVLNIDYPQNPTPDATTLQADFKSQLYRLRQAGMNAIFVQVRPAGDAIYASELAPWSEWLTGVQGQAPVSDFDPLAYMIKTAHAQGIELHAWVNPYRVAMTMDSLDKAPNHLLNTNPEWVRAYNGRRYLDPGLPEVRAHLGEVIDELVTNYDLDGVHFDDYFYPYPAAGQPFPDQETFARYGRNQQLADWRRSNVNTFVAETQRRIKAKKPWVHFGISPYGVWRNQSQDPLRGSATRASVSSYDDLYGDALHWANNGTVDYLLPQLYWSTNYGPAGYKILADWWAANTPATVALYTGHAAYKVGTDTADPDAWNTLEELPTQVAYNRRLPAVRGSVYFSSKSILLNSAGLAQRMGAVYPSPALLPERIAPAPVVPRAVKVYKPKSTEKGKLLVWEVDIKLPKEELPYYYAVYRSGASTPMTLLHKTPYGQACHRLHYYDASAVDAAVKYDYRVVPLDRYHRALIDQVAQN